MILSSHSCMLTGLSYITTHSITYLTRSFHTFTHSFIHWSPCMNLWLHTFTVECTLISLLGLDLQFNLTVLFALVCHKCLNVRSKCFISFLLTAKFMAHWNSICKRRWRRMKRNSCVCVCVCMRENRKAGVGGLGIFVHAYFYHIWFVQLVPSGKLTAWLWSDWMWQAQLHLHVWGCREWSNSTCSGNWSAHLNSLHHVLYIERIKMQEYSAESIDKLISSILCLMLPFHPQFPVLSLLTAPWSYFHLSFLSVHFPLVSVDVYLTVAECATFWKYSNYRLL